MTILNGVQQRVEGVTLNGYMISCHGCHSTLFMPSLKHLPDQVVANKFRETKHWDVNSNGKDFCPKCIIKRRRKKYEAPRQAAANKLLPPRERLDLTPDRLQKILVNAGLPTASVTELELLGNPKSNNRAKGRRRFKATFDGTVQFHFGQAIHGESEILDSFGVTMVSSWFTVGTESSVNKATVSLTTKLHWYLTVEHIAPAFAPLERSAATMQAAAAE